MQRFTACVISCFIFFGTSELSGQVFIDPGAGVVWNKSGGDPRPMINLGVHNLIFNRLGIYGTIELPGRTSGNSLNQAQRDVVGGIIRLNDFISFFGGAGVFSDGILARGFKPQEVRKEAGLMFNIPKARLNIDLGYSNTAGFSFLAGFIIPIKRKEAKNPVREIIRPAVPADPAVRVDANKLSEQKFPDSVKVSPPAKQLQAESEKDSNSVPQEEIRSRIIITTQANKVVENAGAGNEKLPDDIEVLTPGVYAVNGVFRIQKFALSALEEFRKSGFRTSGISYEKTTGFYYVWVLRSENESVVKDFVIKNQTEERPGDLWVLTVK